MPAFLTWSAVVRKPNCDSGSLRRFLPLYLLRLKLSLPEQSSELVDYSRELFQCRLLAILLAGVRDT